LGKAEAATFDTVLKAFRDVFCPSPELVWLESSQVWKQGQTQAESVDVFVTRLRKAARRANLTDELLNHAIIQGLRGPIRMAVLQQGVKGLSDTIRAARIAECSFATDPVTSILMESLKAQSSQIEDMVSKVTKISEAQSRVGPLIAAEGYPSRNDIPVPTQQARGGGQRGGGQRGGQQRRNTPQNQQRNNYGRQQQPAVYNDQPVQYQQPVQSVQYQQPSQFQS
jgi:hypothetical protein